MEKRYGFRGKKSPENAIKFPLKTTERGAMVFGLKSEVSLKCYRNLPENCCSKRYAFGLKKCLRKRYAFSLKKCF
jgi:hypothetical protein